MIKTIEIVSLSSGVIGESFVSHEVELGVRRLEAYGLRVKFAEHARMGLDYIKDHPEARAEDLLNAFRDDEVDMIMTAIGGDDTYRLLPYLFAHDELKSTVRNKIFLGYSDTTVNHFMLRKAGLNTFYGQAFLTDLCELDKEMLPYSKRYFEELIQTGGIRRITPSETWYEGRTDFSPAALGTAPVSHPNRGFELLQGTPVFSGKIFGGCIDTIFDMFDGTRYADMPELCRKYDLFPSAGEWRDTILLLESSEEKMPPEKYAKALSYLRGAGVFDAVSGVLAGKPMDEAFDAEYRALLLDAVPAKLPVVWNLSVGHASPHCILPFGVSATVDAEKQVITFA